MVPFTDQFPFAAAGVPGLWLTRFDCDAGVVRHHRNDDTLASLSTEVIARHLDAAADFIVTLANRNAQPAARRIPACFREEIARTWQNHYGGWEGLRPAGTLYAAL